MSMISELVEHQGVEPWRLATGHLKMAACPSCRRACYRAAPCEEVLFPSKVTGLRPFKGCCPIRRLV